uniref:DDE Tnp4 domain-containing protein n=1 Tax=Anopheles funestus TaxID=62324 RepID=A0A182RWH6_ANOFN
MYRLRQTLRDRRWWTRPMLYRRNEDGSRLLADMADEAADDTVLKFLRMTHDDFDWLLDKISHKIKREDTNMRLSITPRERLLITLRFLATGETYSSLSFLFRVGVSTISSIVPEVCECLIQVLQDYVKLPNTPDEWLEVSNQFEQKWNFPRALGALDGKHIRIPKPIDSGSDYYNYKGYFSINLMAIVDANYNFMYVDVGGKGGISDGGIFRNSRIHALFENNELNIPEPKELRVPYGIKVPYMLVADKAFAFTNYCIRPYGGYNIAGSLKRNFNYRHSRARQVVETAFGILSNMFRIFHTSINLQPDVVTTVVLAAIHLYNFIRKRNPHTNFTAQSDVVNDTHQTENSSSLDSTDRAAVSSARATAELMRIRDHLANYLLLNDPIRQSNV